MSEEPEREFTALQIELADTLMKEEPRIEAALKNYLSLKMAERLTSSDDTAQASRPSTPGQAAAAIQGCARIVLRTLNGLDLPVVAIWGKKNPQGESEPALKYMEKLGEYKVVQALWAKAKASQGKPAKLLGRTALRYAMPEASELIRADFAASAKSANVSEAELESFLSGFTATIDPQVVENTEEDGPNESELVWTTNQAALLAQRQQKRKEEAAEREKRAVSQEQYMQDLRNAMAPANSAAPSGPRIEEVTE